MDKWGKRVSNYLKFLFLVSIMGLTFQNCGRLDSPPRKSDGSVSDVSEVYQAKIGLDSIPTFNRNNYQSQFLWIQNPDPVRAQEKLRKLYDRMKQVDPSSNQTPPQALLEIPITKSFNKQGLRIDDPERIRSNLGVKNLKLLVEVTACAVWLPQSKVSQECYLAALPTIEKWLEESVPTGNPINDSNYVNLFISVDLLLPRMPPKYVRLAKNWMQSFIDISDDTFGYFPNRKPSNWVTWNMSLSILAAQIVGKKDQLNKYRNRLSLHLKKNLQAPLGFDSSDPVLNTYSWKRVNGKPQLFMRKGGCLNPDAVADTRYGSFDLRARDSLHYHMFNLEPLLILNALMGKQAFTNTAMNLTKRALRFTKPYVKGKRTYLQWRCTTEKGEVEKRLEGYAKYQVENWDPMGQRRQFGWADIGFPEESVWFNEVSDQFQPPWLSVWGSLRGVTVGSW